MNKQVAGIVLAAGGSSRFGSPKQLLPWKDTTILNSVVRTAIASGLEPVIVVSVSYTHLRAHETVLDLVCRLLLEKKKYIASSVVHILKPAEIHKLYPIGI